MTVSFNVHSNRYFCNVELLMYNQVYLSICTESFEVLVLKVIIIFSTPTYYIYILSRFYFIVKYTIQYKKKSVKLHIIVLAFHSFAWSAKPIKRGVEINNFNFLLCLFRNFILIITNIYFTSVLIINIRVSLTILRSVS